MPVSYTHLELSKIRANYTCQVSGLPTFKDSKGNNYVESHHIIEFNGEDGPDIICLLYTSRCV